MRRALQLARKGLGHTYPNPMVGCVIVYNNQIIGEGWHHKSGEPHAEINAINSVKDKNVLRKSTLYVTLEPCSHYGKTPPCANKIVELGIPRVVIGSLDPNEKVNGQGKAILENAGIEVTVNVLQAECAELNKRFFSIHQKHRPYIVLKWAQSADKLMDKDFKPFAITNDLAQQLNHQLRADENGILVGTTTALRDNPELTVRNTAGENPVRFLIDKDLKLSPDSRLYNLESPTIIFNQKQEFIKDNIIFVKLDFGQNILPQMLDKMYTMEIQSLIVEGGSFTIQQFWDQNLWDEAWVFEAPSLFLVNGTKANKMDRQVQETISLREDVLKIYRNR